MSAGVTVCGKKVDISFSSRRLSCASGEIHGKESLENAFISGMERGEEEAGDRLRRPTLSF